MHAEVFIGWSVPVLHSVCVCVILCVCMRGTADPFRMDLWSVVAVMDSSVSPTLCVSSMEGLLDLKWAIKFRTKNPEEIGSQQVDKKQGSPFYKSNITCTVWMRGIETDVLQTNTCKRLVWRDKLHLQSWCFPPFIPPQSHCAAVRSALSV